MSTPILGHGIYSVSTASRLIRVTTPRLSAWLCGRARGQKPVMQSLYSKVGTLDRAISFLDLIESLVALRLREHGVSLQAIRRAREELLSILNTSHPFAHKGLSTDGKAVFAHIANTSDDDQVVDAIERQHVFPKVLMPYLHRISYSDSTLLAADWQIADGIIIDPTRSLGQPIVERSGIPASVLASAYRANDSDAELVGDWYGVAPRDVEIAVEFESGLERNAA